MKKASTGLFSVHAFRNNYLAAAAITVLFTLLQLATYAQPNSPLASSPKHDTTRVLQPINSDGFYWTGVGKFGGGLVIPNDTFKLSIQSKGALAYKNGKVYKYTGANWDELGIKKYLKSDGSIAITQDNDTINLATSTAPPGDRIIDYGGGVTLDDSTITAIPNIIVQRGPTKDTINSSVSWDLNREADGYKRVYLVIVDSDNQLDTVRGEVLDTSFAVEPPLPNGAIKFATISVIGSSIEEPHLVGTWQRTAIVIIDDNGNQTTDSARFSFQKNINKLNIGLGSEKVSLQSVPPDYPGGSTALLRAENFQLQSTRTAGDGDLTLDLKSIGFRSPFDEFKFYMNSPSKYINFGHFSPSAPYTYKFSTHSQYTDQDVVGFQFGYKNRAVFGDSLVAADSCPSCAVDIRSLTKGFRTPQMTAVQMNAIASPATGLQVFNTTANEPYYFNGTSWVSLAPAASAPQTLDDAATEGNEILNKTVVIKTNPAAYSGAEITFDPNGIFGGHMVVKGGIPLITTEYHPLGFTNRTNNYLFPDGIHDSIFYQPTTFLLNGNYYSPNSSTGVVNFGTISGGSVDSANFLTKTKTQTVTGSTTFNNTSVGSANLTVTGGVQGVSDHQGLLVNGTYASNTNAHPFRVDVTFNPTANNLSAAAGDFVIRSAGTANIDHIIPGQFTTIHGSTGTVKETFVGKFQTINNGGTDSSNYTVTIANPTGTGTILSNTGLLIENQTKGTTNMGIRVAGTTPIEVGGTSYLLGNTIIGHTTGVAPTATLSVRKNGANSFNMQNNAAIFQIMQPSSSADFSFGNASANGNFMKIYNGGFKTLYQTGGNDSSANSVLWANGSFATAYRTSGSTSVTLNTNDVTFNSDATAGNVTVNVETAVGCKGRIHEVRKLDNSSNTVTVDPNSTETINQSSTIVLSKQNDVIGFRSDGANWMLLYSSLNGETISTVSTYTNYTTTATYQNIASITLSPGEWDLSAFFTYSANSATITGGSNAIFAISTTTASASGATEGKNIAYIPQSALGATSFSSGSISPYRVSPTTSTTYYLNTQGTFSAGNPQYTGTIRAIRVK